MPIAGEILLFLILFFFSHFILMPSDKVLSFFISLYKERTFGFVECIFLISFISVPIFIIFVFGLLECICCCFFSFLI